MKRRNKFTIAGLGEILWDIYGTQRWLGGAPANFALHVQQLGHKGVILSRVGNDPDGRALIDKLKGYGISTDSIQIDRRKPTGSVKVALDDEGKPQFQCSQDVAFDYLGDFTDWMKSYSLMDAILFGTLAQRQPVSRMSIQNFIHQNPARLRIFDANIRKVDETTHQIVKFSLNHAHILKLNDQEAAFLPQLFDLVFEDEWEFYNYLLRYYRIDMICITLGENGALIITNQEKVYSPGYKIKVVDTTGSGDAFIAGLTISFLQRKSLKSCLEFANALGALIATREGAVPKYSMNEITELMDTTDKRNWSDKYKDIERSN